MNRISQKTLKGILIRMVGRESSVGRETKAVVAAEEKECLIKSATTDSSGEKDLAVAKARCGLCFWMSRGQPANAGQDASLLAETLASPHHTRPSAGQRHAAHI